MFSNYNDAWFMNESLTFYMSINTFRNPIFDTQNEPFANDDTPLGQNILSQQQQQQQNDAPNTSATNKEQQHKRFKRFINKSHSAINTKQKLNDFCDSLAFSVKGKVFVFELNFKRRLHRLRKFLDKNLPWILPNKQTRQRNNEHYHSSPNNLYQQDNSHPEGGAAGYFDYDNYFWKNIQPSSPKSLEVQQERLLNRLEKAKRDSQKLFNMENNFASYFIHEEEDEPRTSIDGSIKLTPTKYSQLIRPTGVKAKSRTSKNSRTTTMEEGAQSFSGLATCSLKSPTGKLKPKSQSMPLGNKVQNEPVRSLKAARVPAAAAAVTTTTSSRVSIVRV